MTAETELSKRARELADSQPADVAAELRDLSEKFDKATELAATTRSDDRRELKSMLGCWARLRRRYCEITGEPLVGGLL